MRHLVWDMGGTLIDTYPSVDRTLAEVCRAAGHPVALAEVSRLTRRSIADAGEELARRCGVPADRFTEAYAALKRAWLSDPPPVMAGARDLLAAVTAAGGLNLVVTHRDRTSAEDLLRVHGLVVDELICAPDGHPRKPDPAMYHLGIRRHRLDPADCLAVGDRAIDAEAASAAGLAWARLETPGIPVPLDGGLHIRSLTELLPLVDGIATPPTVLNQPWPEDTPGLLHLPSGLAVRGRGRRAGRPAGLLPEFGVYPAGRPVTEPWPGTWIRWPDFRTPRDPAAARAAIADLYARLGTQRCEVACGGGVGRTGTVLAALAVLGGLDAEAAVRWVRARYHRRAVETPGQRRWLKTLA